jgi:hypothetical protein
MSRRTPVQFRHSGGLRLAGGMALLGALAGFALSGLPAALFGALAAGGAGLLSSPTRIHRFRPSNQAVLTWIEVLGIALTHRRVLATFEDVEEVSVTEGPGDRVHVTVALEGRGPATLEVAGSAGAEDLRQRADKLRGLLARGEAPRSDAPHEEVE